MKNISNIIMIKIVCIFCLLWNFGFVSALGSDSESSSWDEALLSSKLENIRIHADSLKEAWQSSLCEKLGVRTIIFRSVSTPANIENKPFDFSATNCTVLDVLKFFEQNYPPYTHTQDKKTGILWIHPADCLFDEILTNIVQIEKKCECVPMQSFLLEGIKSLKIPRVIFALASSDANRNTFDYPVTINAGLFAVRDILNTCCVANPNRTFFVAEQKNHSLWVYPTVVVPWNSPAQAATLPLFWQKSIGSASNNLPSDAELIYALAGTNSEIRCQARRYLELGFSSYFHRLDSFFNATNSPESKVWIGTANLEIIARTEFTYPINVPTIDELKKLAVNWHGDPALGVLCALEIARATKERKYLVESVKTKLSESDVEKIRPDLVKNLMRSAFLRDSLVSLNPEWSGFSSNEIAAYGNTNVFRIPK